VNRRFRFGRRGSAASYNRETPLGSTFVAGASAVAQQRYTSGFKVKANGKAVGFHFPNVFTVGDGKLGPFVNFADVSAVVNELRGAQARM